MSNMRIFADNFLDLDVVSNATVSSEQAAFPVENAYNLQRRSKVYRSNGFWEVTASNNVLIFRESVGVDLTATIAVDEYTSSTALFTAIKTALEDAGASTYTVSADATTGKVKIVSNGAGGGGIFQLMTSNVLSTMAEMLGFDTDVDKTGSLTVLADELRISTGEWLKWDFGISTNPKAMILIGPRNSPIKIAPNATITLQGNETDVWDNPSYETTVTYDDEIINEINEDGLHTEALRYWRLLVQDLSNPNGYIEIGAIYLGDFYSPTRGAVQFPFRSNPVDRSVTVFSEGGQTFSDIREKSQEFELDWNALTITECERLLEIFNDTGTSFPFFIMMDPSSNFSSDADYYFRYVKFKEEPRYQLISPGVYSMTMALREEL